jgi:hypothetical protein
MSPPDAEQPEFDFSATASEQGYHQWRARVDEQRRAFEARFGVILAKPVEVLLKNHDFPVHGLLQIVSPEPSKTAPNQLTLKLKNLEFKLADIVSITRAD